MRIRNSTNEHCEQETTDDDSASDTDENNAFQPKLDGLYLKRKVRRVNV